MFSKKHAEQIKAWLDGAKIQWSYLNSPWQDVEEGKNPGFSDDMQYRVKPAEPKHEYPQTEMQWHELCDAFQPRIDERWNSGTAKNIANAALRHAIDNGQVVTREEFNRAVGDRKARDMAVALAVKRACMVGVLYAQDGNRIIGVEDVNLESVIASIK